MICVVTYRHPNGNLESFVEYLNSTIERIRKEHKFCVMMSDFNLDLLEMEFTKIQKIV